MQNLARTDPEVADAVRNETRRQGRQLELIASENFVSEAVLEALGTVLTNKYAEGYPGKRYYGGCECVDVAESLAIARAKELFKAEHVNVQAHSGSQANMAAYMAAMAFPSPAVAALAQLASIARIAASSSADKPAGAASEPAPMLGVSVLGAG